MKKFMFVLTAIAMSCGASEANSQILYVNDNGYGFDAAPVFANDGLSSGPIYAGGPRSPANWRTAPIYDDRAYNSYAYSPCSSVKVDYVLSDGRTVIRRGYVC
jgi:hypothetical protein